MLHMLFFSYKILSKSKSYTSSVPSDNKLRFSSRRWSPRLIKSSCMLGQASGQPHTMAAWPQEARTHLSTPMTLANDEERWSMHGDSRTYSIVSPHLHARSAHFHICMRDAKSTLWYPSAQVICIRARPLGIPWVHAEYYSPVPWHEPRTHRN